MWHVLAIWVGWELVLLLGILAMVAIGLWRARMPRAPGERFSSDIAVATTPGLRMRLAAVALLPPLLLTGVWLWARQGK